MDHTDSIPEIHGGDHSHANIDDGFGMFGESLDEEYDGVGTCYSQDGKTFLDLFDVDKYTECRVDNLYYPFASKEEWEVADYLLHLSLSMAAIDEFLKLSMVQTLHLSLNNAKELQSRAEMLPSGPSWKCQIIPSIHPTKSPIQLVWRDPVECLESIFSNPLFHDKLDFIPRHIYKTAVRLLCVYSEWLMGDSAWEMQTQLPRGATILGIVLASDKTNITTMTGARVAHPLLLGLANICMYTYRLIHECLLIMLKPLMKAAEVGIMMSDPLTSITVNPNDLEAYFEACTDMWLNGVYTPFWMDWPLADPSIFLMPESLHHWHKEFYDHDLQWCIAFSILQPTTGYRHFSGGITKLKQHYIIGLISGAAPRHFVIAIRALMDLHYLAQLCIDRSLSTFHEHKDVILTLGVWMGTKRPIENWHIPKLKLLQSITSSTRKVGALIQWSADATEHEHILEIKEPAQQTNNNNYDLQISTTLKDAPEEYDLGDEDEDEQESDDPRTALLEEMNCTHVATDYFRKARQMATVRRDSCNPHPRRTFIADNTAIHLNYNPSRMGVKVDDVSTDFNLLDLHVVLLGFLEHDMRERGVVHGVGGPRQRPSIDHLPILPFDHMQVWNTVRLQQTSFHDPSIVLPAQTVHASPPGPGWPKGRRDTILVNMDTAYEWPKSGLTGESFFIVCISMRIINAPPQGHAICKLCLIMRPLPRRGSCITWRDQYLCYVQCLNIGPYDPATGMHVLKCVKHADGTFIGNIIPLCQLCAFISIVPHLGDAADVQLTSATSAQYSQEFLLNKYFDKGFYYALHYSTTPDS
ncbi:hypothetical protein F4604DRAFT_1883751 [Suillus subluteus]|nr:hypothetical protein F4604DRAFT_1883751 [Suillus subluteus]